ncbi:MAG: hypothetical protein K6B41_02890 [Butyrivibrio sp.]|nr:hypothetical protein [Butyrivibrio sp.]
MDNLFDVAIVFGGMYMLYSAIQLKVNKLFKVGVVIPPSMNERSIKDKEGFISYTYPRLMGQGIGLIIIGIGGIAFDMMGLSDAHIILYLIALVVLLVGTRIIENGKKKFY